jgi:flagellar basal-body rod protein FlgB
MTDSTTAILERVLAFRMKAHEVHTSNIANANVPQFKAKKIAFDKALENAVAISERGPTLRANEQALSEAVSEVKAAIYEDPHAPMKGNGNTVNMEREQTELAKNTIAYEAAIQLINKKFAMARYVLQEGGSR